MPWSLVIFDQARTIFQKFPLWKNDPLKKFFHLFPLNLLSELLCLPIWLDSLESQAKTFFFIVYLIKIDRNLYDNFLPNLKIFLFNSPFLRSITKCFFFSMTRKNVTLAINLSFLEFWDFESAQFFSGGFPKVEETKDSWRVFLEKFLIKNSIEFLARLNLNDTWE